MKWYLKVWKQYADFRGRARRNEFWMFTLFNALIGFALSLVMMPFMASMNFIPVVIIAILLGCYSLAVFVPSLAVAVRRLHDIGKSGWYFFIGCIPLVGGIIILVWFFQDSQVGENKWGRNPKKGQFDDSPKIPKREEEVKPPIGNRYFPRLQCRDGANNFTYKIATPRTTIGRDSDNNLILLHPTVSRYHAEIVSTSAGFEIIDKDSSNKVIVNGQFFQRTMLKNGDIIGLGEAVLTFYV